MFDIRNISQIAIFTAVLCVLSPIAVNFPFSPVPISFTNFAIYIFAIILGTKKAFFGVVVYILLGAVGFPVFSKGGSGVVYIFGPTGGYIVGYLFCSVGTSLGNKFGKKFFGNSIFEIVILALGIIIGTAFCYALGTIWLAYCNSIGIFEAFLIGVVPFVFGDVIKIVIAIIVGRNLRKKLKIFHK